LRDKPSFDRLVLTPEGPHKLATILSQEVQRLSVAAPFKKLREDADPAVEVAFGREGRAGSRVIRIHGTVKTTVSTVSVGDNGHDRSEDKLSWERPVPSATTTANPV
jgi:hypothetical protein